MPEAPTGQTVICPHCREFFVPQSLPTPVTRALPSLAGAGGGVWVDSSGVLDISGVAVSPQAQFAPEPTAVLESSTVEAPPVSEWARDEVTRITQYVARELEKLRRVRQTLVEMESKAEQAVCNKKAELNRLAGEVTARQAELERREAELAVRETEMARLAAEFSQREDAVFQLETRQRDLAAEVADLSRLAAELGPLVERLQLRRDEAMAARAQLDAKQSSLDRRLIEIGRTELALQVRREELNQLEDDLRAELEEREGQLERQRAALDEQLRTTRRVSVSNPTPPPLPSTIPALAERITPPNDT